MANIREITLNILKEYYRDDTRKPSLLKDALNKYDYLDTRDKAFIKRVVDGCIERQIQIDYILDSFSKVKTSKMQPFIRELLRMSVYQIMFMDQIPDSAAVNEAVKLATKHKFASLKGFVNGVLRNVSRNKDKIEYPDKAKDGGIKYLSVVYSMPEWICEMWTERYGFATTEKILKFFLLPRPTVVRLNMLNGAFDKTVSDASEKKHDTPSVDAFVQELENAGVVVRQNKILPYALELKKTDNIRFLPGYEEGKFFVQDVSSMLVTEIADPKPGQVVIDVCAAPGGKSLHAAERVFLDKETNEENDPSAAADDVNNSLAESDTVSKGIVISRDVSERKCDLISENALRLGITNIQVKIHDARVHDTDLESRADILYLDLPCSGLGIIGRKNDIKYNATKQGLSDLSKLQWEIIKTAWDYVKPGGILMYSTCTVNKVENEDMVKRICEELPFETVDITDMLPAALKDNCSKRQKDPEDVSLLSQAENGYIQLLPGQYDTDGFFIAKLRRSR